MTRAVKLPGLVEIRREGIVLEQHVREGRFQRGLALIAGGASAMSGFQVLTEHYRAGLGRRVMYTPILISPLLLVAGIAAVFSRWAARVLLPLTALLTIFDGLAGFYYHIVNINRRPGGWRLPIVNIVMGPPLFAPILFGLSGYLGLVAALLRRPDTPAGEPPIPPRLGLVPHIGREAVHLEDEVREGRFQQQLSVVAALTSLLAGAEAAYSHYQDGFTYRIEWTPLVVAPLLAAAGFAAAMNRTAARLALPVVSLLAIANGTIGFYYHVRGVFRRPGGRTMLLYNTLYGPPVFAPLLVAAAGFMSLLASFLRRAS